MRWGIIILILLVGCAGQPDAGIDSPDDEEQDTGVVAEAVTKEDTGETVESEPQKDTSESETLEETGSDEDLDTKSSDEEKDTEVEKPESEIQTDDLTQYEEECEVDQDETILVDEKQGTSYVHFYRLKDGTMIGPSWKYYDEEKTQPRSFRCYDEDGEKIFLQADWDKEGRLEEQYTYIDGKFNGQYRVWEEGVLVEERYYKLGDLNGDWKMWYDDGTPKSSIGYKNGRLHGTSTTYYANGQTKKTETYDEGVNQGDTMTYYEDGAKQTERQGEMEYNKFTGTITTWSLPDNQGKQSGRQCQVENGVQQDCVEVTA